MKKLITIVIVTSTLSLPLTTYAAPLSIGAIQGGGKPFAASTLRSDNGLLSKYRNAVRSSIVMADGKSFPKSAYSETACCTIGEEKRLTGQGLLAHHGPYHTRKNKKYYKKVIWTAPKCYAITAAYTRVITAGGTYSYGGSKYARNQTLITKEVYNSIYSELKEYVALLAVPGKIKADLNIKLQDFIQNYMEKSFELTSTHDVISQDVTLRGVGIFNPKVGHSWWESDLTVDLVCCPPEISSPKEAKKSLKEWIDTVIARIDGESYGGPRPAASSR